MTLGFVEAFIRIRSAAAYHSTELMIKQTSLEVIAV
jgi:hypothetical protein